MDSGFPCFSQPVLVPHGSPSNWPGWATGARPGHQPWPSPQMSAWRVWRYLGMMQYDLRRLGATSLQWQDWCCCWMNSGMCWFKESTLPECIRFRWQSCDLFFAMGFFSSKVAPGFGKSQVVGEHWMRRGGSVKLCKGAERWWKGWTFQT